ncbi:MAG: [protein-PII] uridylyltransferase [Methylococcales bacterium]|nr:[protein-PII] uridylyltransferase [Methylococcales bacterium]
MLTTRVIRHWSGQKHAAERVKRWLNWHGKQLALLFDRQAPVGDLLVARSEAVDTVLKGAFQHFFQSCAHQVTLVAVGGYGRKELFPGSDIDCLLLLNGPIDARQQAALTAFGSWLWDTGLKPSLSVRTVVECLDAAQQDQTIMTSLLETRCLEGHQETFQHLAVALSAPHIWPQQAYFDVKLQEQLLRYRKFHDTAYNLEPNLKEGPGGLRDLQMIAWLYCRLLQVEPWQAFISAGYLTEDELDSLLAARLALWRIRYALHLKTGRGEDRLLFDHQYDLARQLGFDGDNANLCVERFMRFYYRTVMGLELLQEILMQPLKARFSVPDSDQINAELASKGYVLELGYLEVREANHFRRNPQALLEIFLLLQGYPGVNGIGANTLRQLRRDCVLIDDAFREDRQNQQLFLQILRQPRGVTKALRQMNRYGVLAAYLPRFAQIVALTQYDLFHIYTVDAHTLFVVRNLRRFALAEYRDESAYCHDIFRLIPKPELLYIAALFHDIAKGMGVDHSQEGAFMCAEFCRRHGLSRHDTELAAWLVKHHLLMSMTAQRKDISDPEIIHDFAAQVGSIEYLHHLYLLTVADIRGTNPELWNSWKDALLRDLYEVSHSALHRGLKNPVTTHKRIAETKTEAMLELLRLGLSETAILEAWRHASDDYFLRYQAEEITWHTLAIAASSEQELPLVLLRPHTQRGSAEIFIYTRNGESVFSLSTATLDQLGLTILDARIVTTQDNYVLNSFHVLEQSGEMIGDLHREIHICSALKKTLETLDSGLDTNIARQSRQARHFPIPAVVSFHDDPRHRYTLLELITTDYAGLLSKVGRVFGQFGVRLHEAKITTIGSRAEDVFAITDPAGQRIEDQILLDALARALEHAMLPEKTGDTKVD